MPPRRLLAGREAPRAGASGRAQAGARGRRSLPHAAAARAVLRRVSHDPEQAEQRRADRTRLRDAPVRRPEEAQAARAVRPAVSGGGLGIHALISQSLEMPLRPETSRKSTEKAAQDDGPDVLVTDSDAEADAEAPPRARRRAARACFSVYEKRRVLAHLAEGNNVRDTIEHFYPKLPPEQLKTRRNTILNWRRNAAKMMADVQVSGGRTTRPCGLRSKRVVQLEDVVARLLSSAKKAEQYALKTRRKDEPQLVGQQQLDALIFTALGLPPTSQLSSVRPGDSVDPEGSTTEASAPTMRPLKPGETQFAMRRR